MTNQTKPYEALTSENAALVNGRPEAAAVYAAMDMPWAKLVGQIAQAYGK